MGPTRHKPVLHPWRSLLAAACAALALSWSARAIGESQDDTPAQPLAYEDVAGEIVAETAVPLGVAFDVVLQFDELVESWNPYMTRFGTAGYVAVRAWSDAQRPWIAEDYATPLAFVFVRRGSLVEDEMRRLPRHTRLRMTCVARELFAGRAWIEVLEARALAQYVPEGSILHATRAFAFAEDGQFALAATEFGRALAAPVPTHVHRELDAERQRCVTERDRLAAQRVMVPAGTVASEPTSEARVSTPPASDSALEGLFRAKRKRKP